jgi:hypothetical protein
MRIRRFTVLVASLFTAIAFFVPASPVHAAPQFEPWQSLGGVARGAPAIASWGTGRADVFVRGSDDALWHKWYDGNWSGWEYLGGVLHSAPAAVSWSNGRLDVVVRGSDDALWHKWYDGNWSGWEYLGGELTSAPAIASTSANKLDVVVKGTDNRLWSRRWTGDRWQGWYQVNTMEVATAPAATSSTGQVVAAVGGTDSAAYVLATDSSNMTWLNPSRIGGAMRDDPGIAWRTTNKNVFVRGTDDALWMWHYNDSDPPGWAPIGGVLTSGPSAVWEGALNVDVVVRGTDDGIWFTTGTGR